MDAANYLLNELFKFKTNNYVSHELKRKKYAVLNKFGITFLL